MQISATTSRIIMTIRQQLLLSSSNFTMFLLAVPIFLVLESIPLSISYIDINVHSEWHLVRGVIGLLLGLLSLCPLSRLSSRLLHRLIVSIGFICDSAIAWYPLKSSLLLGLMLYRLVNLLLISFGRKNRTASSSLLSLKVVGPVVSDALIIIDRSNQNLLDLF